MLERTLQKISKIHSQILLKDIKIIRIIKAKLAEFTQAQRDR